MKKSRQYFQNKVAKKLGYKNWTEYLSSNPIESNITKYSNEGYVSYRKQWEIK